MSRVRASLRPGDIEGHSPSQASDLPGHCPTGSSHTQVLRRLCQVPSVRSHLLPHLPSKASERPAGRTEQAAETQVSLGKLSQRRERIPGTNMVSEPQVRGAGPGGGLCPRGLSLQAAWTLRSPLPLFPQFAAKKFLGRIVCKEERNGNNTETMNKK